MAVEKNFRCDLCGGVIRKDQVRVLRVGTLEDRPDGCERLDLGPCCEPRPIADLMARYAQERHG